MKKVWKIQAWTGFDLDLCDASAVLHQLSYQANWELVVLWVDYKPLDDGIDLHNFIWCWYTKVCIWLWVETSLKTGVWSSSNAIMWALPITTLVVLKELQGSHTSNFPLLCHKLQTFKYILSTSLQLSKQQSFQQ